MTRNASSKADEFTAKLFEQLGHEGSKAATTAATTEAFVPSDKLQAMQD